MDAALAATESPPRASEPSALSGRARRRAAALAGAAGLLAVAAALSDLASLLLKWLLDPLAHTTSNAGVLLFLTAFALATVRLALAPSHPWHPRAFHSASAALLVAIALGLGANLAGHLSLLATLGLPRETAFYYWTGSENTYSYLWHSHAGKSAVAELFRLLGTGSGTYDTGAGLADALPGWVGPVCGLSGLVGAAAALVLLPAFAVGARASPARLWAFGLGAFTCLKAVFDGGPLTYRVLPALLALAWAGGALSSRPARGVAVLAALVYGLAWTSFAGNGGLDAPLSLLGFAAWFALPATMLLRRRWQRRGGTAVLGLLLGALYLREFVAGPAVLLAPLPPGASAIVSDGPDQRFRRIEVAGHTPLAVYRAFGDTPTKPRRVFLSEPGDEDAAARDFPFVLRVIDAGNATVDAPPQALRLVSATPLAGVPNAALLHARAAPGLLPSPYGAVADARAHANYHVFLHLLAATLRAQGLREFVLVPVSTPDPDPRR